MSNPSNDSNHGNDISEIARQLASRRHIVEGNCEICGKPFTGTRKRRYCSNVCTQKAYDRRKAQERKERQGEAVPR
jgi:hypothetical protein